MWLFHYLNPLVYKYRLISSLYIQSSLYKLAVINPLKGKFTVSVINMNLDEAVEVEMERAAVTRVSYTW